MGLIHWAKEKIMEKVIASIIERVFRNWITTVIGVLVGVVGAVAGIVQVIPGTLVWHGYNVDAFLTSAASIIGAIALILAKDKGIKVDLPKVGIVLLILSLGATFPASVKAQTTDSTTNTSAITLTTSTDAVVVFQNGNKDAATLISADLKFATFGKKEGNVLYLTDRNLLDPSYANTYAAGVAYEPDLSGLFKKTLIPADSFTVLFGAAAGDMIPVSGSNSHVVGLFNVQAKYRASSKVSWNVLQFIAQVRPNGWDKALSTGLAAKF